MGLKGIAINKDLKKIEIYDLTQKTSLAVHGISYKIKQFFFSKDDTLYVLSKDGLYDTNSKLRWRPRVRRSFAGQGRYAMDMVDHEDKILIILDNANLVIFDKTTSEIDTIELPIIKGNPISIEKLDDSLIIGCTAGLVYF
jgi:hypothetical protein